MRMEEKLVRGRSGTEHSRLWGLYLPRPQSRKRIYGRRGRRPGRWNIEAWGVGGQVCEEPPRCSKVLECSPHAHPECLVRGLGGKGVSRVQRCEGLAGRTLLSK